MNTLKTLFIVAVLGAVAYGVYVSINRNPETAETREEAPAWPEAPNVQLPGPGTGTPQPPAVALGTEAVPPFVPGTMVGAGNGASTGGSTGVAGATAAVGSLAGGAGIPSVSQRGAGASAEMGLPDGVAGPGTLDMAPGAASDPRVRPEPVRQLQRPPSDPLAGRGAEAAAVTAYMEGIQQQLDQGRLAEAHLALSGLYGSPDLPPQQAQEVTDLLDQLAGTVIYSRQHLLEPPYRARPGDTLEQIAETYNVPWQLLGRINGIRDPRQTLPPGQELKVVRGPFSALIDTDKFELTLVVGGRYAGRFPIGVGRDCVDLEGSYVVRDKIVNSSVYAPRGAAGTSDPTGDPPGRYWIDLGNQVGIHGTSDPQNLHSADGQGISVCLGDRDIEDVFGILSIGSRVIIRR